MKHSIYDEVTNEIIEKMEVGVLPWRSTWINPCLPINGSTNKAYRGINLIILFMENFVSPYWMTFKQVQTMGGSIKRGEKGNKVVFWKIKEIEEEGEVKKKEIPIIRHYTVFNELQCEGIKPFEEIQKVNGVETCERIIEKYFTKEQKLKFSQIKSIPYYRPSADLVNVPAKERFHNVEHYYSTLFHELVHSTGHSSRLNRGVETVTPFGSKDYSREELIAELGSAFLCTHTGISTPVINQQTSYISHWLKELKGDSKFIFEASAKAQKAVDYILEGRA